MTDLSTLSDEQLSALYRGGSQSPAAGMSDEQLKAAYQAQTKTPRNPLDMLTGWSGPRYQLWPERVARDVLSLPRRNVEAASEAAAGGPVDVGPAVEAAVLATPIKPRMGTSVAGPSAKPPTPKELLETGGSQIERARTSGVDIAPSSVNDWATRTMAELERKGSNDTLAPETFKFLRDAAKPPKVPTVEEWVPVGSGDFARKQRVVKPDPNVTATTTYDNFLTLRDSLQGAAQKFTDPREQLAASRTIKSLDDYLANIPPRDVMAGDAQAASSLYAQGRGNYAAGKRSETVAEAREDALYSAAAANSGKNIGNRERQTFNSIRKSDPEISGFSPAERSQIEQNIIMGTRPTNFFRDWANRLGGGGGAGQSLTAALGAAAGSPFGTEGAISGAAAGAATLPALGIGARALANKLTDRQITKLDEMVRARSPMAEQTALGPGAQTNAQQLRDTLFFKMLLENMAAQERR